MKTKNYTGISRPSGNYDRAILKTIENNLNYFNANKRKGILTVEHYVDCGDQWRLLKDGCVMLCDMSLLSLHYAVAAIASYEKVMK